MIYDKNQFTFNLIFLLILIGSVFVNVLHARNYQHLNERFNQISQRLTDVEANQAFNFIQGPHNTISFQTSLQGFCVDADTYGKFSGPSMQPTLFDGNTLIEKAYEGGVLQEGQIIRFIRSNQAIIHRVRADYGDEVFVQGDSLKEGEIIKKSQITHVVVGVVFT